MDYFDDLFCSLNQVQIWDKQKGIWVYWDNYTFCCLGYHDT